MRNVLLVLATLATGAAAQGVDWMTDLDKARALARKTNRPMLAVFR
ncbi:MAG: hypothetical protein ACYTGN_08715 [Planctomycetota bacterium]|jgi:hypothetical protein